MRTRAKLPPGQPVHRGQYLRGNRNIRRSALRLEGVRHVSVLRITRAGFNPERVSVFEPFLTSGEQDVYNFVFQLFRPKRLLIQTHACEVCGEGNVRMLRRNYFDLARFGLPGFDSGVTLLAFHIAISATISGVARSSQSSLISCSMYAVRSLNKRCRISSTVICLNSSVNRRLVGNMSVFATPRLSTNRSAVRKIKPSVLGLDDNSRLLSHYRHTT